ncbi:MAG TPA: ABC-type transport auxiliary lipoprotein family protein [Steroidobacteraceae bacterium]|nr:ABC-type transport auxiliary lipoprotein family protein [Steroidobacteraceae bacterium]
MKFRLSCLLVCVAVSGCGSLLESELPAPQAYVLRLPAREATTPTNPSPAGSVLLQRPKAGPGLDSDRIVLLRSDSRFDVYAASRWAAPAPDMIGSFIVDGLRASGAFSAVFDDTAPYAPKYNLRCTLRRFESDYTASRSGSGGAPMVFVAFDCTLGRHRDRELLSSFTAQGSAQAGADRLNEVVAAFEKAATAAVAEVEKQAVAAVANEPRETPDAPAAPAAAAN